MTTFVTVISWANVQKTSQLLVAMAKELSSKKTADARSCDVATSVTLDAVRNNLGETNRPNKPSRMKNLTSVPLPHTRSKIMALKDKIKKTFKEEGIVLYKEFRKATESFTTTDGGTIPATADRWIVGVICSENFCTDHGFTDRITSEFHVPEADFVLYKFGTKIKAKFEMTDRGTKAFQNPKEGIYGLELLKK